MKNDIFEKYKIKKSVPLRTVTRIQIGGPADYFVEINDQQQLLEILSFSRKQNLPLKIMGGGTNVFFADDGFRGMVCVLKFDRYKFVSPEIIRVEAGVELSSVVAICRERGLEGFEFAAGIPGTVGGAIYGNAGAYGKSIGECLARGKILTPTGEIRWEEPEYFGFAYRHSRLKETDDILLEAELKVEPGDPAVISEKIDQILEMRRKKLPGVDVATAGSYFKNLKDEAGNPIPAAKYLEAIGSKNICVGDAAVFEKHANIIINKGNANARDVLELEKILRTRVFEKFGTNLEREVIYVKSRGEQEDG